MFCFRNTLTPQIVQDFGMGIMRFCALSSLREESRSLAFLEAAIA